MGADATAEIQHLSSGGHPLQPQGIGDVISTAEVPGRQLQQVARPHRVLVEGRGVFRPEGSRVQIRQVVGAAGQSPLQLLCRQIQVVLQVLLQARPSSRNEDTSTSRLLRSWGMASMDRWDATVWGHDDHTPWTAPSASW